MRKEEIDKWFIKNEKLVKSYINKMIKDKSVRGDIFTESYLYILKCNDENKINNIKGPDKIKVLVYNFIKVQPFYEKSKLKNMSLSEIKYKELNENNFDIIENDDIKNWSLEDEQLRKLKELPLEYKILLEMIFKEGVVSDKELSNKLGLKPHSIRLLKTELKKKLNIEGRRWREKKIKNLGDIWNI